MFEFMDSHCDEANIKVIGIGGAGINVVELMMCDNVEGVQFIVVDTDPQVLGNAKADSLLLLDSDLTKGPDVRTEVEGHITQTDRESLRSLLVGTDMVFIITGMGGDAGTYIAPVLAEMAHGMGILTVAMVTEPCARECELHMRIAKQGSAALFGHVDNLFILPRNTGSGGRGLDAVSKAANEVALETVRGIVDLLSRPGLINVDFEDVRVVMAGRGPAMTGTGTASGDDRAEEAVEMAINNLLVKDVALASASGILINIAAGLDMMLEEFETVGSAIKAHASDSAIVVVGTVIDPEMQGEMRVTLVATGIDVACEHPHPEHMGRG